MHFRASTACALLLTLASTSKAASFRYLPAPLGLFNDKGDSATGTPGSNPDVWAGPFAITDANGNTVTVTPPDSCEVDYCDRYLNAFNNNDQILMTDSHPQINSNIELFTSGHWKTLSTGYSWESGGTALNNHGDALYVGVYWDQNINTFFKSFLYHDGKTIPIVDPNGKLETWAQAISDSGEIVGTYSTTYGQAPTYGFVDINGKFTTVKAPGQNTSLWFVNSKGEYVAESSSGWWLFNGTSYVSLNEPGTTTTMINGLNDAGAVVGQYVDSGQHTHSFAFENGVFSEIESGHTDVFVTEITRNGDIYGSYDDLSDGKFVDGGSFVGIPASSTPEPATAGAMVTGLLILARVAFRRSSDVSA